jgi:hypothetical protein
MATNPPKGPGRRTRDATRGRPRPTRAGSLSGSDRFDSASAVCHASVGVIIYAPRQAASLAVRAAGSSAGRRCSGGSSAMVSVTPVAACRWSFGVTAAHERALGAASRSGAGMSRGGRRADVHPLPVAAVDAEDLDGLVAHRAEPVRQAGVELGDLARLQGDVLIAEDQPQLA